LLQCDNPLVRQYLLALDAVLRACPELADCVVGCAHCGIQFLTHPRNAGRLNLRCPFGCREHHRRQSANRRSTAYRQTPAGKEKKRLLNARRGGDTSRAETEAPLVPVEGKDSPVEQANDVEVVAAPVIEEPLPDAELARLELVLGGVVLDEAGLFGSLMLPYLRMLVRLIDGIELGLQELVGLLRQALRQRSIAFRSRGDYVLRFLHEHPP